jgi:hypothetical protein
MEMILLDWTRMGRYFCLAGATVHSQSVRIVRPLPERFYDGQSGHIGWPPHSLQGHERWEIVELLGATPAVIKQPHVEDVWVQGLRWSGESAVKSDRVRVLTQTATNGDLFGAPLTRTSASAYLEPNTGECSLATILLPPTTLEILGLSRGGARPMEMRVQLPVPKVGMCELPVIDHHLLLKAEQGGGSDTERLARLHQLIQGMGEQVAVRLGLARPLQQGQGPRATTRCWLMADGFFSLPDPQP